MSFYSGQKVVCIDASPRKPFTKWDDGVTPLVENAIYTILKPDHTIFDPDHPNHSDNKIVVVQLWEAKNPWGYNARRFRPLDERKTDISQFKEMLNNIPFDPSFEKEYEYEVV